MYEWIGLLLTDFMMREGVWWLLGGVMATGIIMGGLTVYFLRWTRRDMLGILGLILVYMVGRVGVIFYLRVDNLLRARVLMGTVFTLGLYFIGLVVGGWLANRELFREDEKRIKIMDEYRDVYNLVNGKEDG